MMLGRTRPRKRAFFLSTAALAACVTVSAGVPGKTAAANVKTIAVVSVYSPKRVQAAVKEFGKGWTYMDPVKNHRQGEDLSGKDQTDADVQALYDTALAAVQARLAEVPGWTLVPFSTVGATPAYKAVDPKSVAIAPAAEGNTKVLGGKFSGKTKNRLLTVGKRSEERRVDVDDPFNTARERPVMPAADDFRVAPGMLFIPIESVTDGEIRIGFDPYKAQKETLARLATDLNVDAVALVDVTPAYRYDKPVTRKTKDHMTALPRVATRLVLVSRDGHAWGDTGALSSDKAPAAEGAPVELVKESHLRLEDTGVRKSFDDAIQGAAARLAARAAAAK